MAPGGRGGGKRSTQLTLGECKAVVRMDFGCAGFELADVERLKEKLAEGVPVEEVRDALRKLSSLLVDVRTLKETGVGRAVNALAKRGADADTRSVAAKLVEKWRENAEHESGLARKRKPAEPPAVAPPARKAPKPAPEPFAPRPPLATTQTPAAGAPAKPPVPRDEWRARLEAALLREGGAGGATARDAADALERACWRRAPCGDIGAYRATASKCEAALKLNGELRQAVLANRVAPDVLCAKPIAELRAVRFS